MMTHTNCTTPARVYLHPAAATSPQAIRGIERAAGRLAIFTPGHPIRLVELSELATVLRLPQAGGAA